MQYVLQMRYENWIEEPAEGEKCMGQDAGIGKRKVALCENTTMG